MIMKFLNKVPAGMMLVPLLIGAFLNTFFSGGSSAWLSDHGDFFQCRCVDCYGDPTGLSGDDTPIV